ncbi:hypothetical protein IQ07DRAFT_613912 [Pyrenochaeta sp. DS3sAY3a]|nr:hypothetical protein IQ07DRAFT_613912 [Pyrenochaeta sp. DS3sAY3a]
MDSYSHSHSLWESDTAPLHLQTANPVTPVHSPHHSVASSASSRTPLHTLTLHEYRKQQYTPISQKDTPPSKALRRKAAAPALSDIERVPSIGQSKRTRQLSSSSARPLLSSRSAQHLYSAHYPHPHQQHSLLDLAFRSQSAEPRFQSGSISSISTVNSSGKVCHFNSRKRLPRPPAPAGGRFPSASSNSLPIQTLQVAVSFPAEYPYSSDAQTTPTQSTFSLSRFPQPPHLDDPSFSPPRDERERTRINALSFATSAPVTPPATPAIIHYRGTSFDLVNPRDSLMLHDIVTPSRDFDSSEYLPLHSAEEPLIASDQMAPKRALYGDFTAAHAGILRHIEDSPDSDLDLPLPPTPAAVSPSSSAYTSPMYSPESISAPLPLSIKKRANDSRFSLKQLSRKLSHRISKASEGHGEDSFELRNSGLNLASMDMDEGFPRPLTQTYITAPEQIYSRLNPGSPLTPTSIFSPDEGYDEDEVEGHVKPLTSMIPDDPSVELGRGVVAQASSEDEANGSKPYYEELESIYPSSSVYTADGRPPSNYQQSRTSAYQSNPFLRYSEIDPDSFASNYKQGTPYSYGTHRPQSSNDHSTEQGGKNLDTISKIIDRYNPPATSEEYSSLQKQDAGDARDARNAMPLSFKSFKGSSSTLSSVPPLVGSVFDRFDFGLEGNEHNGEDGHVSPVQDVPARRVATITHDIGSPPRHAAPLAPALELGDNPVMPVHQNDSEMFSESADSYGDTRNLLRIPQTATQIDLCDDCKLEPSSSYSQPQNDLPEPSSSYSQPQGPAMEPSSSYSQVQQPVMEPSSSYSQPGDNVLEPSPSAGDLANPATPQEALDQADAIFQSVTEEKHEEEHSIPAMWARRHSGSRLFNEKVSQQSSEEEQDLPALTSKEAEVIDEDKAEWETLNEDNRAHRESYDSIADYSSDEDNRVSLGLNPDGTLPAWAKEASTRGSAFYNHPSPLGSHPQTFASSPPVFTPRNGDRRAFDLFSLPSLSPSPAPRVVYQGAASEPRNITAWNGPYAFSDKETQELLASGPNENISFVDEPDVVENPFISEQVHGARASRTRQTGSSIADNSSPGLKLSSSVGRRSVITDYDGFYATPFDATGSVTRIPRSPPIQEVENERTPSQITLFPSAYNHEAVQASSPLEASFRRQPLRGSTTFERTRRASRSAVCGQTKLRQMVLASEGRATMSSQDTQFSRFIGNSGRPSTSDTSSPLRPLHTTSIHKFPAPPGIAIACRESPHMLFPERQVIAADEEHRRKLSWFILALFCLLPPCIVLFRIWGDYCMSAITAGRLGHCTPKSKRVALIAGIVINISIVAAISVPILVLYATGGI